MSLTLEIFFITAGIILTGLVISIIFRNFNILIKLILPLLIIGGTLWLGKYIRWRFPNIPRPTIYIISGIAIGILILIRALTSMGAIIKNVLKRIIAITISFLILRYLVKNWVITKTKNRLNNVTNQSWWITNIQSNNSGEQEIEVPTPIIGISCDLPRWWLIQNNFYVYAFQNRSDSSSLCDVEIRLCKNWNLWWTFTQPYCYPVEDNNIKILKYVPETKTYSVNPLIQPWPAPYRNAKFTIEGKRFISGPPPINITIKRSQKETPQNNLYTIKSHCITPWGEVVKSWQFVKAYNLPVSNQFDQCLPELRLCNNGKLLGDNIYPDCKHQQ